MTEFGKRLKEIATKRGISVHQLGRELGIPRGTIGEWVYGASLPTKEKYRRLLASQFPGQFPEFEVPLMRGVSPRRDKKQVAITSSKQVVIQDQPGEVCGVEKLALIYHAQDHMMCLIPDFERLLFQASREMRGEFRARLGRNWERFLDLTRALVSEKAFEVLEKEGQFAGHTRKKE
jgi:transcriptional regulator with XRE-family HTH domain